MHVCWFIVWRPHASAGFDWYLGYQSWVTKKGPLVGWVFFLGGTKNYPVIFRDYIIKPWNKDPKINQPGFLREEGFSITHIVFLQHQQIGGFSGDYKILLLWESPKIATNLYGMGLERVPWLGRAWSWERTSKMITSKDEQRIYTHGRLTAGSPTNHLYI